MHSSPSDTPENKERETMTVGSKDVDLTGGFRLDLKTLVLILGMAASWYDQRNSITRIQDKLSTQELAESRIEEAKKTAEEERWKRYDAQLGTLTATLAELKGKLTITGYDINDLSKALSTRNGK